MKRKNAGVWSVPLVIGAILLCAAVAYSATVSWTGPTTYTDGSGISADNQARITYEIFYGPSATGPWTGTGKTAAGAKSGVAPDPAAGNTWWYTVSATLDGNTGAKAAAKSKTVPFKTPGEPVVTVDPGSP